MNTFESYATRRRKHHHATASWSFKVTVLGGGNLWNAGSLTRLFGSVSKLCNKARELCSRTLVKVLAKKVGEKTNFCNI